MKLCLRKPDLMMNILQLKYPPHVTSEHAQTVGFWGGSEFTGQNL